MRGDGRAVGAKLVYQGHVSRGDHASRDGSSIFERPVVCMFLPLCGSNVLRDRVGHSRPQSIVAYAEPSSVSISLSENDALACNNIGTGTVDERIWILGNL